MSLAKREKEFAIVRRPGKNFAEGVTTADLGEPIYAKALKQHESYCDILRNCGLYLIELEAEPLHPDAPFVEDTAVVTPASFAIVTNLSGTRRQGISGEEIRPAQVLSTLYHIFKITEGTVEGGDVLRINNTYYIGLSSRTNLAGARQLAHYLSLGGFESCFIPVENILHLKTGITYIGNNNILTVEQFAERKEFIGFNVITVDKDEEYAANCLLINDILLIPYGFPKTKKIIQDLDYRLIEVEMSEYQKMDGGLTCLSIIF